MRILLTFGLLACLVAIVCAGRDDDNMGFDEASSGDGIRNEENIEFPTDDEDIESEGSGTDNVAVVEDSIDVDDEPELTGTGVGRNKVDNEDTPVRGVTVPKVKSDEPIEKEEVAQNDLEDEEVEDDERSAAGSHGMEFMAAVVVGGCIGLLFAICVIMLLVYRMRKKDEGSYALEYGLDSKKPQGNYEYTKGVDSKEYFA